MVYECPYLKNPPEDFQGHLIIGPNLFYYPGGNRRYCFACLYARTELKETGTAEFYALADQYYAEIMGGGWVGNG